MTFDSRQICVLPGPSRESLSGYSTRVKVSQERLGVGAEVSALTVSNTHVSFSSQISFSQGGSTSCPDQEGAIFSGKFW